MTKPNLSPDQNREAAVDILDASLVPEQLDAVIRAIEENHVALLHELNEVREKKRKIWGY